MKVRELYDAIGNSTLSPDADCVVVEDELGVRLEGIAPPPPPPPPEPEPEDNASDE